MTGPRATIRVLDFTLGGRSDALRTISAIEDRLPPNAVLQIPLHGFCQSRFECLEGSPSKLSFDLGRINGIAAIVPWSIGDERYKPSPRPVSRRLEIVEKITDRVDDVDVCAFATTADVVGFADAAALEHKRQGSGV